MGWELPASPTCQPNGPASTRCSALLRSSACSKRVSGTAQPAGLLKSAPRIFTRSITSDYGRSLLLSRTQLAPCSDCMPRYAAHEGPKRGRGSVDLIVVGAVGEGA